MKMAMHSARVRPTGSGGFAQRTAAGFVVVGSADASEMLPLIEANQHDPSLIEVIAARVTTSEPDAFGMLFTSSGNLHILMWGSAQLTVETPTARLVAEAQPGRLLIEPLNLGTDGQGWRMLLTRDASIAIDAGVTDSPVDLQSGTVPADAVHVAAGIEAAPVAAPPAGHAVGASGDGAGTEAGADSGAAVVGAAVAGAAPTSAEPGAALAGAATSAEPAVGSGDDESVVVLGSGEGDALADSPPAAKGIVFADDRPADDADRASDADVGAGAATPSVPEESPAVEVANAALGGDEASSARPRSRIATITDPPSTPPSTTTGGSPPPVMVLGVPCPEGHHNHPDATHCTQCGQVMETDRTTILLNGPRPPIGVLIVDDGTTHTLGADVIIGREPATHDAVRSGTATALTLSDETLALSRRHARIVLDDWSANVIDLYSSNGTWLHRDGAVDEWAPVPSDVSIPLEPGDQLRIGGRVIQVELHH